MKVIFLNLLIIVSVLSCKNKKDNRSTVKAIQIISKRPDIFNEIEKSKIYNSFFVSYNKSEEMLQISPIKNDCITHGREKIHFYKNHKFTYIFRDKETIEILFKQIKSRNINLDKCKIKFIDSEKRDPPLMCFILKGNKFNKIKDFEW